MRFPPHFFYTAKSGKPLYNYNPNGGQFVVEKFLRSRPYWKHPNALAPKKKTLIITDWTMRNMSASDIEKRKQLFKKLLKEGFTLYIWQHNSDFIKLNEDNLDCLDDPEVKKQIKPIQEPELEKIALAKLSLTKQKIHSLDDYWIDSIQNESGTPIKRKLKMSNFIKPTNDDTSNSYNRLDIVALLQNAKPPLQQIVNDTVDSCNIDDGLLRLQSTFDDITVINQYENFILTENSLEELFEKETLYDAMTNTLLELKDLKSHPIKKLTIHTFSTSQALPENIHQQLDLTELTSLILEERNNKEKKEFDHEKVIQFSETFLGILRQTKNLENLTISWPHLLNPNIYYKNIQLPKLRTATFGLSFLDGFVFKTIIRSSTLLKEINFIGASFINNIPSPINLPQLEKASFMLVEMGAATLENLLSNSKKLKSLIIMSDVKHNSEQNMSGYITSPIDLPALEDLIIGQTSFEAENLEKILIHSPALKILAIKKSELRGKIHSSLNLPKLEEIYLAKSEIETSNLEKILSNAKKLKNLDLTEARINGLFEQLADLPYVEKIFLFETKISIDNIITLIKKCPNLKTLQLSEKEIDAKRLQTLLSNLPHIEHLDLRSLKIKGKFNSHTAVNLKTLKKLALSFCHLHSNNFTWLTAQTPYLEDINLLGTELDGIAPKSIALPLIKKISTTNIDIIEPFISSVEHLESLAILCNNISPPCLYEITNNNRHLKSLTLKKSKILRKIDRMSTLYSLQELDLSYTEISNENLETLIASMPNLKKIILDDATIPDLEIKQLKNKYKNIEIIKEPKKNLNKSQDLSLASHDPRSNLANKPTSPDFIFNYCKMLNDKSQKMIVQQFSQYLTLTNDNTNNHVKFIPKANDGICAALVSLFNAKIPPDWDTFINDIQQWDGKLSTLQSNDVLQSHFSSILKEFKKHYIDAQVNRSHTYLGNDSSIKKLLTENNQEKFFSLYNPWHAISIKRIPSGWLCYDPNDPKGYKEVKSYDVLIEAIHHSLGNLVSVDNNYNIQPVIPDAKVFIKEGGLLVLGDSSYSQSSLESMLETLKKLPIQKFSKHELEQGLCLRTTNGKPAWKVALESKNNQVRHFADQLIKRFTELEPHAATIFAESIADLSSFEKYTAKEELILTDKESKQENVTPVKDISESRPNVTPISKETQAINAAINRIQRSVYYESRFETWKSKENAIKDALEYCQFIVSGNEKTPKQHKRLIELSSTEEVNAMSLLLQDYCLNKLNKASNHHPVFYVESPDDLVCAAPFIDLDKSTQTGILKKPGGPLYDFITAPENKDKVPIIIVNYENFTHEDMVQLNTLIDAKRKIDNIDLPDNAIIVGLTNASDPDYYRESDFRSRFDVIETCPLPKEVLTVPKAIRECALDDKTNYYTIELNHGDDWREQLLGKWELRKDQLCFIPGKLEDALQQKKPIEIKNGPWDSTAFRYFWDQAFTLGRIKTPYHEWDLNALKISANNFVRREGYDWAILKTNVTFTRDVKVDDAIAVNPTEFSQLFTRYECNNEAGTLNTLDGIIKDHKNQSLHINLTRNLSEDEWGKLLQACQEHHVTLHCHCAPGVTLPEALTINLPDSQPQFTTWAKENPASIAVIHSDDVPTTVALITDNDLSWEIIDVSECSTSDLLTKRDGTLIKDTLQFTFKEEPGALNAAINKKENTLSKNIILKGKFSPELADALAPLLLSPPFSKGKLRIVADDPSAFSYVHGVQQHQVNDAERKHVLLHTFKFSEKDIDALSTIPNESLDHLRTRLIDKSIYGNDAPERPWYGLAGLSGGIKLEPFDPNKEPDAIAESAAKFIRQRKNAVEAVLSKAPYVFLAGLTGVGKSTFVEDNFADEKNKIYFGVEKMLPWATDNTPGQRKILFIDEANIGDHDWSEFEGLFDKPPSILINGKVYPLTENHKVIFAGNPLNYSSDRKMASLFEHHGNTLIFDPLPADVIYELILKPIFNNNKKLAPHTLAIAKHILDVYQFLCECSADEVLISPRELQMMALLTLSQYEKNSTRNPIDLIEDYAYELVKDLVPTAQRAAFEARFKPGSTSAPLASATASTTESKYVITSSRQSIYQQLNDLLDLREYRQKSPLPLTKQQLYGGLGGIVLEGNPGVGKSELINHVLKRLNPAEICRIPANLDNDKKRKKLIKAFHRGQVAIIDEINSSPMIEDLLNDLLMGKGPNKERPGRPGFMLIGTQNPTTLSGRHQTSNALKRRILNRQLFDLNIDEMYQIFMARGLTKDELQPILQAFQTKRQEAKDNNYKPEPTFRDLETVVNELIEGKKREKPYNKKDQNEENLSADVEDIDNLRSEELKFMPKQPATAQFTTKCLTLGAFYDPEKNDISLHGNSAGVLVEATKNSAHSNDTRGEIKFSNADNTSTLEDFAVMMGAEKKDNLDNVFTVFFDIHDPHYVEHIQQCLTKINTYREFHEPIILVGLAATSEHQTLLAETAVQNHLPVDIKTQFNSVSIIQYDDKNKLNDVMQATLASIRMTFQQSNAITYQDRKVKFEETLKTISPTTVVQTFVDRAVFLKKSEDASPAMSNEKPLALEDAPAMIAIEELLTACGAYKKDLLKVHTKKSTEMQAFIKTLESQLKNSNREAALSDFCNSLTAHRSKFRLHNDPETHLFIRRVRNIVATVLLSIPTLGAAAGLIAAYAYWFKGDATHFWSKPRTRTETFHQDIKGILHRRK